MRKNLCNRSQNFLFFIAKLKREQLQITNVETQCLASHCSIKRSAIETQSIESH
ncbi:MAG: hypothetical protein LBB88_11785 [Planctomycetaceae bacterium]|nr:hypothetical protein [Planctomycetaceae bacterium]